MFDLTEALARTPNGTLATHDGESLKMRVFQCLFSEGRRAFFCTGKEKDVYRQLIANAEVAFCGHPADFAEVVSISGKAVFVDDLSLKARILEDNPLIRSIYKSPDNPAFAVFYIDVREARTFSFAEGPRAYQF